MSILFLVMALVSYSIKELALHGKLRWSDGELGFWGEESWRRKYAWKIVDTPENWYYRFFKIKYKERFPLSATALVFITDGMHFAQFMFFNFLSLSLTFAIGWNWYLFGGLMIGIRLLHWLVYKIASK